MTAEGFRKIALAMPDSVESSHMGHPDFRVGGKIFATLDAAGARGVVKLTPEQQAVYMAAEHEVFSPCSGAWGARGYTFVELSRAKTGSVRRAVRAAWENTRARTPR
jgi:hypothetical protein